MSIFTLIFTEPSSKSIILSTPFQPTELDYKIQVSKKVKKKKFPKNDPNGNDRTEFLFPRNRELF